MKKNSISRLLSLVLCFVLVAAIALFAAGCGTSSTTAATAATAAPAATEEPAEAPAEAPAEEAPAEEAAEAEAPAEEAEILTDVYTEDTELGEGSKLFTFEVTDLDGNTLTFTIHTDADTVGDALLAVNLIAGEDSQYGLYVKQVNGITADWDVDGHYWAFYIDGEYAMTGVDATELTDGSVYSFRVE